MPWKIRSNWQDSQVKGPILLSYFLENLAVGSISGVEDFLAFGSFNDEAAP